MLKAGFVYFVWIIQFLVRLFITFTQNRKTFCQVIAAVFYFLTSDQQLFVLFYTYIQTCHQNDIERDLR